jgi:ribosomal protein L11 methyltransferase
MREVVLKLPRRAVEDVLDRLLPIVPGGVREHVGRRQVELRMRGDDVPPLAEISAAAGRWTHALSEHQVSDDWRERRVADYEADVIGGRVVVRPEWAPVTAPGTGLIDIVVGEDAAFGGGGHPTTRTCLQWLLELDRSGAFADLGCGTGVLAILAARLGWRPVCALDVEPGSVESARANAERNGVAVECTIGDLMTEPPPPADAFAANVPPSVHEAIAANLGDRPPRAALLSGFGPSDAAAVIAAYQAAALPRVRRRETVSGWVVVVLGRD